MRRFLVVFLLSFLSCSTENTKSNDDLKVFLYSFSSNSYVSHTPTFKWSSEGGKNNLYYRRYSDENFTKIDCGYSQQFTLTDSLVPASKYYWKVEVYNDNSNLFSDLGEFTTDFSQARKDLVTAIAKGIDVSSFDVSSIHSMRYLMISVANECGDRIWNCSVVDSFNDNISGWNVSNVENMEGMFYCASSFNQNLSGWDVSKVTSMKEMFIGATKYNNGGKLLKWDEKTSKVIDMSSMFSQASKFNQDISGFDVSSVSSMKSMFYQALSFDNGGSKLLWGSKTKNVKNMYGMFWEAQSFGKEFEQDLSGWDVSNVTDHSGFRANTVGCQIIEPSWK